MDYLQTDPGVAKSRVAVWLCRASARFAAASMRSSRTGRYGSLGAPSNSRMSAPPENSFPAPAITTAFTALSIPVSVAQQFCIRSLISTRQKVDSREFLARRVLENGEALAGFGRPLQSLGLRLFFPPTEADRATYQVRIENWPLEPRSLWVEVVGSFGNAVAAGDLPKVAEQLYATYGFLTNQVGSFLAAHDGT